MTETTLNEHQQQKFPRLLNVTVPKTAEENICF